MSEGMRPIMCSYQWTKSSLPKTDTSRSRSRITRSQPTILPLDSTKNQRRRSSPCTPPFLYRTRASTVPEVISPKSGHSHRSRRESRDSSRHSRNFQDFTQSRSRDFTQSRRTSRDSMRSSMHTLSLLSPTSPTSDTSSMAMPSPSRSHIQRQAASPSSRRENVSVFCRVRPKNRIERLRWSKSCIQIPNSRSVTIRTGFKKGNATKRSVGGMSTHSYDFDRVFGPECSQELIYIETAEPMVESLFQGYNNTMIAYGQTGAGKTFTMMGDMDSKLNAEENICEIHASYVEIYMEKVIDLLSKSNKNLKIRRAGLEVIK
ncbi:hypothetical protein AAMO2058_001279900 [Amorphochlora amoebiformis]